jgi:hypothetical protein
MADPLLTALVLDRRRPADFDLSNLIYPPIVSPTLLLVAYTLPVVKPWGRIRGGRRP